MAKIYSKLTKSKLYLIIIILIVCIFYFLLNLAGIAKIDSPSEKLFPMPQYNDIYKKDRILSQLAYQDENIDTYGFRKTVYLYPGIEKDANIEEGLKSCNIEHCIFTSDMYLKEKADAVIFNREHTENILKETKPKGQVWVYYEIHSASSSGHNWEDLARQLNSKINFTATYRRDSVLVTPHAKFVPHGKGLLTKLTETMAGRNFAEGKTKMVAWFVSSCHTRNGRMQYVRELQKYIDVDIYGDCGDLKCPKSDSSRCNRMLSKDYKFYLAFESTNCVDYISEKLYQNGLNNDVIPIVMGARPDDYASVAPPKSFIHVDHFESPKELAKYLKLLNENDDLYNQYFKWKGTGEFINTKFWCRLCAMLYASDSLKMWYDDFIGWYNPKGVCIAPKKGMMWSSWRTEMNNLQIAPWKITS